MLKATKSRFYLVPVLMRTLDILELLFKSDAPLKTNEIARATGVSQTTTYRILRTLLHRGYVTQDIEGRFSMLHRQELESRSLQEVREVDSTLTPLGETDLSGEQVIEVLDRFLQSLRQHHEGSFGHVEVGVRQRQRI